MAASPRSVWLLWALLGAARGCTEPCACVDKYAHQFADCAYKDLQEVPSGLPANVTTLSLSANKITSLRQGAFAEVTQVTSLWLAHNEIRAVEPGALAVLAQLKNLDISHNQIADFPWADLRNLSALQLLKMNNNRMAALPADAFRNLRDLRSLRINNNRFSFIAEGTFDALTSLSHLQIYNNPFDCTCRLLWLKAWAESTLISIPERESIACASPPALKGVPLGSLPALQCAPPAVRLRYQPDVDGAELEDGLALALHCLATGQPPPRLQWRIETAGGALLLPAPNASGAAPEAGPRPAPPRFRAFANGTLLIPHLSKKEEGTYTCRADNELGSNETSVSVAVAGPRKHPPASPGGGRKAPAKGYGNSVLTAKGQERTKGRAAWGGPGRAAAAARTPGAPDDADADAEAAAEAAAAAGEEDPFREPPFERRCGRGDPTVYVSNHAFNQSSDLKPHAFDLGVIALDVSEREAKVQLTPFAARPEKRHLRMLYLCAEGGHAAVQWSRIEEGVNAYWFQGLTPGTNYSVCLTYVGEACQVQVVFTTKKEVPSLVIIVVVSVFLLALATVPLLGAACCHLLAKYQGKTYRLIMKAQNPDQMEKRIAADFDPRASYLESEKNYSPTDSGRGLGEESGPGSRVGARGAEEEEDERQEEEELRAGLQRDESLAAGSLPESQSKANQEEFEASSEYSDRLPLGAEAVDIAPEINGNYRQTER